MTSGAGSVLDHKAEAEREEKREGNERDEEDECYTAESFFARTV